jgi:hypothetical protein
MATPRSTPARSRWILWSLRERSGQALQDGQLKVRRMLDDLTALATRWSEEHRGAPDLVSVEQIERLRQRLHHISRV